MEQAKGAGKPEPAPAGGTARSAGCLSDLLIGLCVPLIAGWLGGLAFGLVTGDLAFPLGVFPILVVAVFFLLVSGYLLRLLVRTNETLDAMRQEISAGRSDLR